MKLKWTRRALEQLVEAQEYIARENPVAARQVGERIADATRLLLTQPRMGHQGRVAGTLEWVVRRTPYFLVYKLEDDLDPASRATAFRERFCFFAFGETTLPPLPALSFALADADNLAAASSPGS